MPRPASTAAVTVRRVPSERPGFARYEVHDATGLVGVTDIAGDADHDDLLYYLQSYHARHPRESGGPQIQLLR